MSKICEKCNVEFEGKTCPSCKESRFSLLKKGKLRMILEIAGGILLLILIIAIAGMVPKSQYSDLKASYDDQLLKLESTKVDMASVQAQYDAYKTKMEPYEGLEAEEAEARRIEVEKATAEKAVADKAAAEKAAADKAVADKAASASIGQKNALKTAKRYLGSMSFSYTGLIKQLEYEGYSTEDATYAVDICGADWNEQAALKAQSYMDSTSFSRDGLIEQLIYEGFSQEQAAHGATVVGY